MLASDLSPYHFGWRYDPKETERVMTKYGISASSDLDLSQLVIEDDNKDIFAWDFEQKVLGKLLSVWDQSSLGSCVSHGSGRAAQDIILTQVALTGSEEWPGFEVNREAIYGGSRVEIGGERGSYEDGSVGSWAAGWLSKYGVLFNTKYGNIDLSNGYNVSRCREWGAKGVPDEIEPEAKKHPIQTTTMVNSSEDAWALLGHSYWISICGSKGRTMKRQSGGWCPVSGQWNHCQELCGRCTIKGGKRAFVYRNSWGQYLGSENNQIELESGNTITLPDGCYLSHPEEIESELRQQDTFAYSAFKGFPSQRKAIERVYFQLG
jgi:hypothetical protein